MYKRIVINEKLYNTMKYIIDKINDLYKSLLIKENPKNLI